MSMKKYEEWNANLKHDNPPSEKIVKLGRKITDGAGHIFGGVKVEDPEYWGLAEIVSDEMAGTIYDIMWRRDIYPSKKEIVKDIRHHELYVLEKDNKIIGAMVLNHEYDECYNKLSWQIFADDDEVLILHRLCIHPQYRGCGKFLIKQAIEIAKFLNQKAIRLDVLCTNKPAIYLYEKCGFLLQGYQTMDYGEPVVAGLYERLI